TKILRREAEGGSLFAPRKPPTPLRMAIQSHYPRRYADMHRLTLEEDIQPLSEFRADAAGLIERVRATGRPLILTQSGHSSAVVLAVSEYERLLDEVDLLRGLHTAVGQLEEGRGVPHEEALQQALSRVRR